RGQQVGGGLGQQAAVAGEPAPGVGVGEIAEGLEQQTGGLTVEGLLGHSLSQLGGGLVQAAGAGQGGAEGGAAARDVRPGQEGLVVVGEPAGQPGEQRVQAPAQQSALGLGLGGGAAGVLPGGALPLDAEAVESVRVEDRIQHGRVEAVGPVDDVESAAG